MDVRNYCVECDMPKPCDCDEYPMFSREPLTGNEVKWRDKELERLKNYMFDTKDYVTLK